MRAPASAVASCGTRFKTFWTIVWRLRDVRAPQDMRHSSAHRGRGRGCSGRPRAAHGWWPAKEIKEKGREDGERKKEEEKEGVGESRRAEKGEGRGERGEERGERRKGR